MSINARFSIQRGSFDLELDLCVPAQGVTAIFGISGSGKTTLLRAIAGLDFHANGLLDIAGDIWQNGREFRAPHLRSVGYVFQEASLFEHMTVQANLDYAKQRANHRTAAISFEKVVALLEIEALLSKQPVMLSGGERQRVAIARALCAQPDLLLMDEPLTGLDNAAKARLLPLIDVTLQELGIPCLYVSHSIEEVSQLADHLVLLEAGRVVAQGKLQTLLTQLDLPMAQDAAAESIVPATVVQHDEFYNLTYLDSGIGRFSVMRKTTEIGSKVRIRILARDISLTLHPQTDTSILNIFSATVTQLQPFGESQITVKLRLNETTLLARITRKSADLLGLKAGLQVYAQAKTVSLF